MRALRRDRDLLERERVVVAEGVHLVGEALRAGLPIEAVAVSPRLPSVPGGADLERDLRDAGVEAIVADDEAVRSVQDARSAQPAVAIVRLEPRSIEEVVPGLPGTPLVVVAHGIQDPGNLGSLMRSAAAAGATGFVVTGPSAHLRHPRTVRATMGSIFHLPAASGDAAAARAVLARHAIPTVGADPRRGIPHDEADWRASVALVIGAEGAGLGPPWEEACAARVRIVMREGCESLSVPAAGAVVLFEAARQRRLEAGAINPRERSGG